MNNHNYNVIYSDNDQQFVGLCLEFPSLSWLDDTEEKALEGIKKVVDGIIEERAAR